MVKVGSHVRCLDSVPWHGIVPTFVVRRIFMCDWENIMKAECEGLGQTYKFALDNLVVC